MSVSLQWTSFVFLLVAVSPLRWFELSYQYAIRAVVAVLVAV